RYQAGQSAEVAAGHFGYDERTCLNVLKRNGITPRRQGEPCRLELHEEAEIVRRYEAGETLEELAWTYEFVPSGILGILRRHKVNPRHLRKYTVNDAYFSNVTTDAQAWLLGMISADGWVHHKPYHWSINLNRNDEYMIERIKKEIGFTGPVIQYIVKKNAMVK